MAFPVLALLIHLVHTTGLCYYPHFIAKQTELRLQDCTTLRDFTLTGIHELGCSMMLPGTVQPCGPAAGVRSVSRTQTCLTLSYLFTAMLTLGRGTSCMREPGKNMVNSWCHSGIFLPCNPSTYIYFFSFSILHKALSGRLRWGEGRRHRGGGMRAAEENQQGGLPRWRLGKA